jgi:hypothetical protein
MSHDPDVAKEIVTWVNALWLVPALSAGALYLMGGLGHNFWHSFHGILNLR